MDKTFFVDKDSVVRQIWGSSDTILVIFAGAAAEFALNKAVDWLYFTGSLPADPLGRLFSTVSYARTIVFSEEEVAMQAINNMVTIHARIEARRQQAIPDWAYRDVLFMLIDYSIRSFEWLERKLDSVEKDEVFQVFNKLGKKMKLKGLPRSFEEWEVMRNEHLEKNLAYSYYTHNLFTQYHKHLGGGRYRILKEVQRMVVPDRVRKLLGYTKFSFFQGVIPVYKLGKHLGADRLVKVLILPSKYKKEIMVLDAT